MNQSSPKKPMLHVLSLYDFHPLFTCTITSLLGDQFPLCAMLHSLAVAYLLGSLRTNKSQILLETDE